MHNSSLLIGRRDATDEQARHGRSMLADRMPVPGFALQGLNVTIAAQWRVRRPLKHAPVAEHQWIRRAQNHWCASPVQTAARKSGWNGHSIISSWLKRLVLAEWAPFIRRAIRIWIAS